MRVYIECVCVSVSVCVCVRERESLTPSDRVEESKWSIRVEDVDGNPAVCVNNKLL